MKENERLNLAEEIKQEINDLEKIVLKKKTKLYILKRYNHKLTYKKYINGLKVNELAYKDTIFEGWTICIKLNSLKTFSSKFVTHNDLMEIVCDSYYEFRNKTDTKKIVQVDAWNLLKKYLYKTGNTKESPHIYGLRTIVFYCKIKDINTEALELYTKNRKFYESGDRKYIKQCVGDYKQSNSLLGRKQRKCEKCNKLTWNAYTKEGWERRDKKCTNCYIPMRGYGEGETRGDDHSR